MGRHRAPGPDDATEELPAVRSGRHRGEGRATRKGRIWPEGVSDGGDHERRRTRARGHRPAPYGLHLVVGAITLTAVSVAIGVAKDDGPDLVTVRPERVPAEGRFTGYPGAGSVTSGPVARFTGPAASPSRPVTGRTPRPVTSKSPRGGTPVQPRQAGSPSVSPSPGGGGTGVSPSSSAQADPTATPSPKCRKRVR